MHFWQLDQWHVSSLFWTQSTDCCVCSTVMALMYYLKEVHISFSFKVRHLSVTLLMPLARSSFAGAWEKYCCSNDVSWVLLCMLAVLRPNACYFPQISFCLNVTLVLAEKSFGCASWWTVFQWGNTPLEADPLLLSKWMSCQMWPLWVFVKMQNAMPFCECVRHTSLCGWILCAWISGIVNAWGVHKKAHLITGSFDVSRSLPKHCSACLLLLFFVSRVRG